VHHGLAAGNHEIPVSDLVKDIYGLFGALCLYEGPMAAGKPVQSEIAEITTGITGIIYCKLAEGRAPVQGHLLKKIKGGMVRFRRTILSIFSDEGLLSIEVKQLFQGHYTRNS